MFHDIECLKVGMGTAQKQKDRLFGAIAANRSDCLLAHIEDHVEARGIFLDGDVNAWHGSVFLDGVNVAAAWTDAVVVVDAPDLMPGWPWNGYELRLMKEAGKYPPKKKIIGCR